MKDADYKDAAEIYEVLYTWKATITATNNDPDATYEDMDSISKYDPVYVHLVISGGTPNETILIEVRGRSISGNSIRYTFNTRLKDGDTQWFGWSSGVWVDPDLGTGGSIYVSLYNKDTGEFLDDVTITINNY